MWLPLPPPTTADGGRVDNLLRMEEHSSDGQTLKGFPYNQMHHYVEKITASYAVYTRLYGG